ncbi:MAG: hypothetical protein IM570_06705 [Pseudanabaena sp. M179S2SP2A07QC]|nr:hypothetical protein [Pseudanabaena sp. M179S2SP2A07QC]
MSRFKLFRFNVLDQLPVTEDDTLAHADRLTKLLTTIDQEQVFTHLYGNLSILDAKSASLLQFNSVLVAIFTIFITSDKTPVVSYYIGVFGTLTTLISCALLLEVVWVHWSTNEHMGTVQEHALKLLEVRKERTILYRKAWNCSKFGLLTLILMLLIIVGMRLFSAN